MCRISNFMVIFARSLASIKLYSYGYFHLVPEILVKFISVVSDVIKILDFEHSKLGGHF